jgi:hypothetical protein
LQRRAEIFARADSLVGGNDGIFANCYGDFAGLLNLVVKIRSGFEAPFERKRERGATAKKHRDQNNDEPAIHFSPRHHSPHTISD